MPNKLDSHRLGLVLCEALGIDASDVRGIEIKVFVGEAAIVKITRYIKDVETQQLIEIVSKYELILKE